ncbi:MAG: hypothetical protein OEM04_06170, partial [Flavobacteriaceae bacterium]|nr:hypothetical protein [Flavobacteriaceae bacterium]
DLSFLENGQAPTNVEALFTVTQDNTGLVSIMPSADGATQFEINYGDGTAETATIGVGKAAQHNYGEGTYNVDIIAKGVTGLKTEFSKELVVSFQAPKFGTEPIVEADKAVSKQVNVTVPNDAQFATYFDVHFVENDVEVIISGNMGETVSYVYANPGLVDIKIVLKGAAMETTEYLVTDFEVIEINAPVKSAPTPDNRAEADYISLYTAVYNDLPDTNFNPDWGQSGQGSGYAEFDLNGDKMLLYTNLSYQGIALAGGTSIDVSGMEYLHLDVWTPDVAKLETSLINGQDGNSTEKPVWRDLTAGEWTSIDIAISEYTDQGLTVNEIFQLKLVGDPWAAASVFVDNLYFWKEPSGVSALAGSWKLAPEAGALGVGPNPGDYSWWASSAEDVVTRACLFDDEYIFNLDGSFANALGADTWVEGWQGAAAEGCDVPVAPHDGTNPATYTNTANTVTVSGLGAYLGIPKVHNAGEDGAPANNKITYNYVLSPDGNTLELTVPGYGGTGGSEEWYFKLVRTSAPASPLAGSWKLAPEAGALGVGPNPGDYSWWASSADDVNTRACLFDDAYVFSTDGSFANVLGTETWVEGWQGAAAEGCDAPVAPHDGSNPATYTNTASTVTISGLGAYLGIPKVHNAGEDGVPVNNTITYNYVLSPDGNTLELTVPGYGGTGGSEEWYFKLVKQ